MLPSECRNVTKDFFNKLIRTKERTNLNIILYCKEVFC